MGMQSSLKTLWRVVFGRSVTVLRLQFFNLSIDREAAASNTKKYEDSQENTPCSKPLIEIVACSKAKTDAARHG